MTRQFRNNNSQNGNSNISTVFEIAIITTYILLRIECSNAFSLSQFESRRNSLTSATTEKINIGSHVPNHGVPHKQSLLWKVPKVSLWKEGNKKSLKLNGIISSTSLSLQFCATMPSLEETLLAFSPKEISNTLRPFEGWYNKWDATGNPSCYSDWEEGEAEDTLKSPTYSWSAYSEDDSYDLTSEKDDDYRSTPKSSSILFSKKKDDEITGPQVITKILIKLLILLTASAKIITLV